MTLNKEKTAAELIEEARENAIKDRNRAAEYLGEIVKELASGNHGQYKDYARDISKLMDNLAKSNEQIVKLAGLLNKKEAEEETISEDDLYSAFEDHDAEQREKEKEKEEKMDAERQE